MAGASAFSPVYESPTQSFRVSTQQQGFLFHRLEGGARGLYNVLIGCRFREVVDPGRLEDAVRRCVDRHPILRSRLAWSSSGEPVWRVGSTVGVVLEIEDLSMCDRSARDARLRSRREAEVARPFEDGDSLRLRALLTIEDEASSVLMLTVDHCCVDGASIVRLTGEILEIYDAGREGRRPELGSAPGYEAYTDWQAERERAGAGEYWSALLEGYGQPLRLSDLFVGDPEAERGLLEASVTRALPEDLDRLLQTRARELGVTFGNFVQAAWAYVLARYSGRDDVVFGATRSSRRSLPAELRDVLGPVIGTVPIRVALGLERSVAEVLRDLRRQWVAARAYEHVSSEPVRVAGRELPARVSGADLFDTLVIVERGDLDDSMREAMREGAREVEEDSGPGADPDATRRSFWMDSLTHLPLQLTAYERPRARLQLTYDESAVTAASAERLVVHLERVLRQLAEGVEKSIAELDVLTAEERHRTIVEWNETSMPYSADARAFDLVRSQAAETPDAAAVVQGERTVSYRELAELSSRVASRLSGRGVSPGTFVGVCLDRDWRQIGALLGTMEAGGCFVPLDPELPPARLDELTGNRWMTHVLTEARYHGRFEGFRGELLLLEDAVSREPSEHTAALPRREVSPSDLAYAIFTSGSTGKPKAVLIEHRALVAFTSAYAAGNGVGPGDRVLQVSSFSFDSSMSEVFPPLASGAAVVVATDETTSSIAGLLDYCRESGVTVLEPMTALWEELTHALESHGLELSTSIRRVETGGERVRDETVRAWRRAVGPGVDLYNMYGPTEATVVCMRYDVGEHRSGPVSIGRPHPNVEIYILDALRRPVPVGVIGELYVGGAQLARGYLEDAGRTRSAFPPHPFSTRPGDRIYRTGDRALFLEDGNVVFLGRADRQVKVRGFRIELDEVEAVLREHAAVAAAVVVVRGSGPSRGLLGVVELADGVGGSAREIEGFLRERLPRYMVPRVSVAEALPRHPDGRVALEALENLRPPAVGSTVQSTADPTEMELTLIEVFKDLLDIEEVGLDEDFFALGGHSLLAMRMVGVVTQVTGRSLRLADLVESPTISTLARSLGRAAAATGDRGPFVVAHQQGGAPPLFGVCGIFGHALRILLLGRHLDPSIPVVGLEPPEMSWGDVGCRTIAEMAEYYARAIVESWPEGPYRLLGTSFGGIVAYEVAIRLQRAGREVSLLALVDTSSPLDFEEDPALERSIARRLESDPDLSEVDRRSLEVARVHRAAAGGYRPERPFEGAITYFYCTGSDGAGREDTVRLDARLDWDSLATAGLRIVPLAGSHGQFHREPQRSCVVEVLSSALAGEPVAGLSKEEWVSKVGSHESVLARE